MRNKKIKPKNKPEASVVFAEIESKLPEDLVLKSTKTKTGIAVYTKYFVKTRPYYIKKQYKILSGGKRKLEYSFYDIFSTIFQGASGKIQEGHQELIKILCIQDGTGIYKAICGDISDSEPTEWFEDIFGVIKNVSAVTQVGTVDIDPTSPNKTKAKNKRLRNKIESLRRFAEYAGVTPSIYFKYFNYKMHEFFRSTEDDKFIIKYCLKYSNFGCRLDPFLETYYYKNRNMFLKLMNSQYLTLIPFMINPNGFSLLRLVKLGLHKNTLHKNTIINECLRWKSNKNILNKLKDTPTGVAKLIANFTKNGSVIPSFMFDWINYEKQHNKIAYKNMNIESLRKRYVNAIREVKEMLLFPAIKDLCPAAKDIDSYTPCFIRDEYEFEDNIKLGKFVITKNLRNYIEALHDVSIDCVIKDVKKIGEHGMHVRLDTGENKYIPISLGVTYGIEVEE